ncbi:MAG: phosphatase PAP2 family protein [Bacteroidota bacterium]
MAKSHSTKELLIKNKVYFLGLISFFLLSGFLLLTTEQGEVEFMLNRYRSPFNDGLWGFLTQLAEEYVYFILIVVLAAVSYRKALAFGVIALLVPTTSGALKALFGAPRPMRWFYDFAPDQWAELFRFPEVASTWSYTSFPSGHATSAFAIYGFIAFCAVGRSKHGVGLLCILAAISVAISRQYLLFHFLKDVVAGALLGTLIASGVYLWQQSWWPGSTLAKRGFLNISIGKV